MGNIIPRSEGVVTPEQYERVKKELRDVVEPIADGKVDLEDGVRVSMEALGAIQAVREIPSEHRAKVIAAALGDIGSEIGTDLVVIYPEEQGATA